MTTSRSPSSIAAFSLVETALAIGVIGFAFVSLLTLLPVGLANFRSAIDTTVCAQIFQRVISDAEQDDFDRLTGTVRGAGEFYILPTRFFDEQGIEVVPRRPGNPSPMEGLQIVYHVHIRGSAPGLDSVDGAKGPERFTSLPAGGGGRRFSPRDSTILTVQIAHHPGSVLLPLDSRLLWAVPRSREGSLALATFSAVLTRNGFPRQAAK